MALAFVPRAPGLGQFLAIFWRISSGFDPISEGTRAVDPGSNSRPAGRHQLAISRVLMSAGGSPSGVPGASLVRPWCADPGRPIAVDRSRPARRGSRFGIPGRRIADPGSRPGAGVRWLCDSASWCTCHGPRIPSHGPRYTAPGRFQQGARGRAGLH